MKRRIWLPPAFLLYGIAFYVYFGVTWNAWLTNLPYIIIYIGIVLALAWALNKKYKMSNHKNDKQK